MGWFDKKPKDNGKEQSKANTDRAQQSATASSEAAQKAAGSQRAMLAVGQLAIAFANTPEFKSAPLASVLALIVPAVASGQYLVAIAQSTHTGRGAPVAAALWASVSDEVDRRLSRELDKPFQIAASEWNSGPHAWLVALVGDRRAINPMLAQMQKNTLKGRTLKMRSSGEDGKAQVRTYSASA